MKYLWIILMMAIYSGCSGKMMEIEIKEHLRREIHGPWQVAFSKDWDAPEEIRFDQLVPWNEHPDPGIQVYSGMATYTPFFICGSCCR